MEATFTCRANGIPAPSFRWLLNGTEHSDGVTTVQETSASTVEVESTLVLASVSEGDTCEVMCVAFHETNGTTVMSASTANLVVLSEIIIRYCMVGTMSHGSVHARGGFSQQKKMSWPEQLCSLPLKPPLKHFLL